MAANIMTILPLLLLAGVVFAPDTPPEPPVPVEPYDPDYVVHMGSDHESTSTRDSYVEGESVESQLSRLRHESANLRTALEHQQQMYQQLYQLWYQQKAQHDHDMYNLLDIQMRQCVQKAILDKTVLNPSKNELAIMQGRVGQDFMPYLLHEFAEYTVRFQRLRINSVVHYEENAIFTTIMKILQAEPEQQFDRVLFQVENISGTEPELLALLGRTYKHTPKSPQFTGGNACYDRTVRAWLFWNQGTMANYHLYVRGPHGPNSSASGSAGRHFMQGDFDELELVKKYPGSPSTAGAATMCVDQQ